MTKLFASLKKSKSGASAAEYALIVAVMGGLVVTGVTALGGGFTGAMSTSATQMNP